ncbi:VWA domain-containing protein [Pseudoduganella lutea]|uniref:VWA domain-containing protein n=1 Tax=Pseudoduganella lutea TaxID=321985 RepID=A0A4P6L254_9BURK|nr:VWA domain-containing protein [Pseudoduganella lutea]QBE65519.1 VWA domain-containing protein [Pseudoduganella lutea]
MNGADTLRRWRLALGRYARPDGGQELAGADRQVDEALDYLYGRAYDRQGILRGKGGASGGSLDGSQLTALDWLRRTRELFPQDVCERLQRHALDKFGLNEILHDPATLRALEPDENLARALLGMRGRLGADMQDAVRDVIGKVVEDITRRLRHEFVNALSGRRNRFRRSMVPSAQNFDWRATIAANLRHYDTASRRLVIERPYFNSRVKRQLPWDVILCVDQSGSMVDSVLYSAIVASILVSLPSVNIRLVVFDTNVVDLTRMAADPVQVLLTVQLGGGTDVGRAMRYCEQLVTTPQRTIIALVSDFEEGAPPGPLLACVQRLAQSRVRLLGLAALDERAQPVYDRDMGQRLAARGMEIAALTPSRFAGWLAEVIG